MRKITETAKYHLWVLDQQKGPLQVNTLRLKWKNIRPQTLEALATNTWPKLVRIRKGYYGRKDRFEITAKGRAHIRSSFIPVKTQYKWRRLNEPRFYKKVK